MAVSRRCEQTAHNGLVPGSSSGGPTKNCGRLREIGGARFITERRRERGCCGLRVQSMIHIARCSGFVHACGHDEQPPLSDELSAAHRPGRPRRAPDRMPVQSVSAQRGLPGHGLARDLPSGPVSGRPVWRAVPAVPIVRFLEGARKIPSSSSDVGMLQVRRPAGVRRIQLWRDELYSAPAKPDGSSSSSSN